MAQSDLMTTRAQDSVLLSHSCGTSIRDPGIRERRGHIAVKLGLGPIFDTNPSRLHGAYGKSTIARRTARSP
jgi:hypothetical protein